MDKNILLVTIVLVAIYNIIVFCVYGYDKSCAKKGKWRVSENTLIGLAACGGAIGASLGIYVLRHKTRHLKFTVLVPLFLLVQIVIAVWLIRKFLG